MPEQDDNQAAKSKAIEQKLSGRSVVLQASHTAAVDQDISKKNKKKSKEKCFLNAKKPDAVFGASGFFYKG